MKKLFCTLAVAAILIATASCSAPADEKSDFFAESGTAILTGEFKGADMTLKVDYSGEAAEGEMKITILEPKTLAGTEFRIGAEGAYCAAGDLSIPLSDGAAEGIKPLAEAMRISANDIISAQPDYVTARRGGTDYYVSLGEGGRPARISWSGGDFEIAPPPAE